MGWRFVVSRRVVVNLKTGTAVDGVLVRRAGALLFLKDAVLHERGVEPVRAESEVVIDRANIDFIQAL